MNKTRNMAVVGAQWGDEGKGKIVDLLCEQFDVVARYQGGHNAGHTVRFADQHYALRLIPSGILHPGKLCVLGNGMVIDPQALLEEIEKLRGSGVVIEDNLKISDSAHCILPYHGALDLAREQAAGAAKIGTTGRGIGPAYESKVGRVGVLMGDLFDRAVLREKIELACAEANALLGGLYGKEPIQVQPLVESYLKFGEILADRITNTAVLVNDAIRAGKRVMFEGAQGTMLDVDHGSYPYVTSSNTVAGGICTGLGVPPRDVGTVMGIAKAYTTRVGSGPFPTELQEHTGEYIRKRGNEYGTVTGRPRRTGWLDLVVLRTAAMVNGLDELALTKIDVLDELDEIRICVAYRVGGKSIRTYPRFEVARGTAEPEYCSFRGWKKNTVGTQEFSELPEKARSYVRFIEEELGCPASIISTGPRREETILRRELVAVSEVSS
jgi:adenylosuccinate synthase